MNHPRKYEPLFDFEGVLDILQKISILGGLDRKQLYSVFGLLKTGKFERDEIIFRQGDSPDHIYIVRRGLVKIVRDLNGAPMEIFAFKEGHCFGETSILAIEPHSATAVAQEMTELIVLSRRALLSIYQSDKKLFSLLILNIAREASRRLHRTEEIMLHYVCCSRQEPKSRPD